MEGILYYQGLYHILEIIWSKFITCYHNNLLAGHYKIKKTNKFIAKKYFASTFGWDVKVYVKDCNIYLTSEVVYHKPYRDLQLILIYIYY